MNDRAFRMAGRNQVFVEYRTLSRFIAISFANFDFALHTEGRIEPRPDNSRLRTKFRSDRGKHGAVFGLALFPMLRSAANCK